MCLALAPVIVAVLRRISRKVRRATAQSQQCTGRLLQSVREALEASRVIKMGGAYDRENRRFDEVSGTIARLSEKIALTNATAMLAVAIAEVNSGRTTLGSFVTFLSAMLMILPPLRHLTGVSSALEPRLGQDPDRRD